MTKRVTINLVVFGALAALMVAWALTNVIRFDLFTRPYNISVEFASSPGLHPGFEVDYLGLRIGKIDSVRLAGDKVVVKLDIDKDVEVPRGVHAAAARKSAVGEPVVELTPAPGQASAAPMRPGERIPVERTTVPPKYGDLFGAVVQSLKAIDPDDAKVLVHELAEGWSGREGSLRQIIDGGDQLTATLAENSELLDGLTKDFGRITGVLNENRGSLGAGIDNVAALTAALAQVRGELAELRDRGPGLLRTVNTLFDKTGPDFECTIASLGDVRLGARNPDYLTDLRRVLRAAPELNTVLRDVIGEEGGKPVLNVVFQITLTRTAALEYKYPLAQPGVNKKLTCPGGRDPAVGPQKPYRAKDPGATIPTHDPSIGRDAQLNAKPAANNESEGTSTGPPRWLMFVPPVLALAVLYRIVTGSVPAFARRARPSRRRRRGTKD
ncbi:MCE family protein [Actinomadura flavalba]|uniref:MCE family protein n=1 Tax=Actinomadura flavalba TaxID=1120938 RepID=UPI0003710DC9|nr:MlaD family protein [Actinomadura flavalba]